MFFSWVDTLSGGSEWRACCKMRLPARARLAKAAHARVQK